MPAWATRRLTARIRAPLLCAAAGVNLASVAGPNAVAWSKVFLQKVSRSLRLLLPPLLRPVLHLALAAHSLQTLKLCLHSWAVAKELLTSHTCWASAPCGLCLDLTQR